MVLFPMIRVDVVDFPGAWTYGSSRGGVFALRMVKMPETIQIPTVQVRRRNENDELHTQIEHREGTLLTTFFMIPGQPTGASPRPRRSTPMVRGDDDACPVPRLVEQDDGFESLCLLRVLLWTLR